LDAGPGRDEHFVERVRHAVERREVAAEAVRFSWAGLALVVVEYLRAVFSVFGADDDAPPSRGERS